MSESSAASPASCRQDATLYCDLVEAELRRQEADGWSIRAAAPWRLVSPDGCRLREQGWKLHLSATPLSAPTVLARAARVLVAERAAFKFAATPAEVAELVSAGYDRSGGGKFITVYPADDDQFRRLAEALHLATAGLPGPGILSDRPYRADSLVHYRFGAFRRADRLTADGILETMLRTPDDGYVRDLRQPRFAPPPWAPVPPLTASEPVPAGASGASKDGPKAGTSGAAGPPCAQRTAVLLDDRYEVRSAIRHSYRGGVYLATDRKSGRDVVVKEARRHVGATLAGIDATDLLRNEGHMLERLAEHGLCPRALGLFHQGGNLYLVQERIAGLDLRAWTTRHLGSGTGASTEAGADPTEPTPARIAEQLVDLVRRVHGLGLVLRDLSPGNLMVTPDGALRLVDLEALARPGDLVQRVETPGYTAPETAGAPGFGPAPAPEADLFSLGAVLFHLLTGADPVLAPDRPALRDPDERRAALLDHALAGRPELHPYRDLVLGLMAEDPARRTLPTSGPATTPTAAPATGPGGSAAGATTARAVHQRLLDDGLGWLLRTMTPDDARRLWPAGLSGATTDPLNVQHGAAGVLGVLTAAARASDEPRLREGVSVAARWIGDRIGDRTDDPSPVLPGLYFGRSGTAWALLDAARLLDDDALAGRAADLAARIPVRWPNPDVCHGVAGAGLAQLHFWQTTGDPRFRRRAETAAEHLLGAATTGRSGTLWPVPPNFDSAMAGIHHLGFGHGVAGIATFLLLAGQATGREDFLDAANRAGETLLRAARIEDGAAGWAMDDRRPQAPAHPPQWCSGAAGIGTFLTLLWQAGADPRHREAAEQAATAVHRWRHRLSPAACHGLAGNAEFLLDLADALAEPRYRHWADDLVAAAHARSVVDDGLLLVPDETLARVHAAYNTGLSGLLGLLTRLRHGGTRLWLPAPGSPRRDGEEVNPT
ncbi:class IV lanthionine synthetase LanL [Kitasatospora sp. RG8]|uniref:class IV lanthionine synthetase LanL n=1 Tax=Kitasatospora sp. RG8 TaxID=2820815 RepID=UPI001ADF9B2C|nr:class IV lanthionine synthetase LanL [Kitasatospora sp. RG8]MBP0454861.1 class IV lanthionine synthetase LanL [Kitasatospora sp. RG8]